MALEDDVNSLALLDYTVEGDYEVTEFDNNVIRKNKGSWYSSCRYFEKESNGFVKQNMKILIRSQISNNLGDNSRLSGEYTISIGIILDNLIRYIFDNIDEEVISDSVLKGVYEKEYMQTIDKVLFLGMNILGQ